MPCWFLATRGLDAFHDYIHTVGPVFIAIVFLLVCRHLVSYRATTPGTTLPAPSILYTVQYLRNNLDRHHTHGMYDMYSTVSETALESLKVHQDSRHKIYTLLGPVYREGGPCISP